MTAPAFSVILSTYNRGRHIVPTIASVLRQDLADFELLVIGDACTDDTEAAVQGCADPRVTWYNLPQRAGSQSGPNNAGLARARGRYIAYLGHDDLWAPDHLTALGACFAAEPDAAFAVSGAIFYGPPASGEHHVTGLFTAADAPLERFFFPPSSIAHRRDIAARIGPWRHQDEVRSHVDEEFMLRAMAAGLRFASTGRITVHKIAGGFRYLSYLYPDSAEQDLLLRMMAEPGFADFTAKVVRRARAIGKFMSPRSADFSAFAPGQLTRKNRAAKGLERPSPQPLLGRMTLPPFHGIGGRDWRAMEKTFGRRGRWSGPSPRPKLLLAVSGGWARLRIKLSAEPTTALDALRLSINGAPVRFTLTPERKLPGWHILRCTARLKPDDCSVIEFDLTGGLPLERLVREVGGLDRRIALGKTTLRPLRWPGRLLAAMGLPC